MAGTYPMNVEIPATLNAQTEPLRVVEAVSPTVTVEENENGALITIHDLHGTTQTQINNGATGPAGADGVSPTIAVTDITGGHRVTITDATGAHSFDVMDGDSADAPVQDVQVNGTSILSDGVANVPMAGTNGVKLGVVALAPTYGVSRNASGRAYIVSASSSEIKNGVIDFKPVITMRQHESTFYGLAKAAGSDEKNSTLPMGTYTDAAKMAILTMLGVSGIIGSAEGATASQAYAAGDAFLHAGALYKATASIAQGDAIVPGTNCSRTTIIDLMRGV